MLALILAVAFQDQPDPLPKLEAAVRPGLVGIEFVLKKKSRLERAESGEDYEMPQESRVSLDAFGVVLGPDRIAVPEPAFDPNDVEKARVFPAAGEPFEAAVSAVGRKHGLLFLRPKGKVELTPIAFAPFEKPELGSGLLTARLERVDLSWQIKLGGLRVANAPLRPDGHWVLADEVVPGSIVASKDGTPIGVAADRYLWIAADGRSSIVTDDEGVSLEAVSKLESELQERLGGVVRKIELSMRGNPSEYYADRTPSKITVFGFPIDKSGTYLVPADLSRDTASKIQEIRVFDGKPLAGTFVGLFKTLGAYLIRVENAVTTPVPEQDQALRPGELFYLCSLQEKFGSMHVKLTPNRVYRLEKAIEQQARRGPRYVLHKPGRPGSLILNASGQILGFYSADKKVDDVEEAAMEAIQGRPYYFYRSYESDQLGRLFLLKDLRAMLENPAEHFDAKATPKSKREERKLVWLGIEYQELNKSLAEMLGVLQATKDGRRGLLITLIYPNSPAQRIGLKLDDILLSVQQEGGKTIDMVVEEGDRYGDYRRYAEDYDIGPVRPQRNYLNTVLSQIGAGKKVSIVLVRGSEEKRLELTLEDAPPTLETADKFKEGTLGFTVKELTYEVKDWQKMKPDEAGVVVARVEPGSKAKVAKLSPYSVIRRVNRTPVKDLAHFKQLVEEFLRSDAKAVTLETMHMGQTRFVDVERP